tara:strand:+ start:201 stop:590 length:390 start_codon:yes stop_codon:yes gene_type:complete
LIRGIGTDLVEKKRVKNLFLKYGDRFVNRILTIAERQEFDRRKSEERKVSFLSNSFASKEALSKVLETGFSLGVSFKNMEILRKENGCPYIVLSGKAQEIALEKRCQNFELSITDTKDHSLAFVVGQEK